MYYPFAVPSMCWKIATYVLSMHLGDLNTFIGLSRWKSSFLMFTFVGAWKWFFQESFMLELFKHCLFPHQENHLWSLNKQSPFDFITLLTMWLKYTIPTESGSILQVFFSPRAHGLWNKPIITLILLQHRAPNNFQISFRTVLEIKLDNYPR